MKSIETFRIDRFMLIINRSVVAFCLFCFVLLIYSMIKSIITASGYDYLIIFFVLFIISAAYAVKESMTWETVIINENDETIAFRALLRRRTINIAEISQITYREVPRVGVIEALFVIKVKMPIYIHTILPEGQRCFATLNRLNPAIQTDIQTVKLTE